MEDMIYKIFILLFGTGILALGLKDPHMLYKGYKAKFLMNLFGPKGPRNYCLVVGTVFTVLGALILLNVIKLQK